ncbi:MAG: NUDIX hydrolase [Gammaproteobacteria bacterium]
MAEIAIEMIRTAPAPEPAIGIGGILFNRDHEVLLIKRDKPPARGLWSIPGGKQEAGESMVEACQREFAEETALNVEVLGIMAVVERRIENFHYVIIDFLAVLKDEGQSTPTAQSDVSEARWVGMDKLGDYQLVEGLPEIIRRSHRVHCRGVQAGLSANDSNNTDFLPSG